MPEHPALQPILDTLLDGTVKGFPADRPATRLGDVGKLGLRLLEGEVDFPAAVLKRPALEHNARWMGEFVRRTGACLCPHGKTTMAPQLFHRQLADGAWGITLATLQEARIAYRYGVKRILLANEALAPGGIAWVQAALDADPEFDFTCLVDSPEGVARLEAGARGRRPVPVLVELGIPGGRTGARGAAAALDLARAVQASDRLRLRGVECYEGIVLTRDPEADRAKVRDWLEALGDLARACDREGLFEADEVLLSAGGSAYFDLVVLALGQVRLSLPTRVVLRSGCYFSHDAGHYQHLLALLEQRLPGPLRAPEPLRPALEIWGQVLSRPEPGLAFLGLGKRDCSYDLGLPAPAAWARPGVPGSLRPAPGTWRVTTLYDQHARLELPPGADLQVGDLVGCGISHPCTAFDKWQMLFEVDGDYRILGAVRTFF
jgi:D-serine dehydratase